MSTNIFKTIMICLGMSVSNLHAQSYVCKFKIHEISKKTYLLEGQRFNIVFSEKDKHFIINSDSVIVMSKQGSSVVFTQNNIEKLKCVKNIFNQNDRLYTYKNGKLLNEKKEIVLTSKLEFIENNVVITVNDLGITNPEVISAFFYKALKNAKDVNNSNLFLTGILSSIF